MHASITAARTRVVRHFPLPGRRFGAAALLFASPLCAWASEVPSLSSSVAVPVAALGAGAGVLLIALAGLWFWRRSLTGEFSRRLTDLEQRLADRERSEQALLRIREDLESQLGDTTRERNEALRDLANMRKALERQMSRAENLARVDDLTGLANRARFDESLDDEIKRMVRERKALSMLLCEIDQLDAYVATDGDERGQTAQKKVASAIDTTFRRAGDLVARMENGQVAVVLPATDSAAALRFAERLRKNVWDLCIPFDGSDVADRLTVSVGVATAEPDRLHKPKDLLAASQRSLFTATENGRNRVGPNAAVAA